MAYENIAFEVKDRIGRLTINRPDKRNSLNMATRREMIDVLDRVAGDRDLGVLVLTGAGDKAFVAGSDLSEFGRMAPLEAMEFMTNYAGGLYNRFELLDIPTIAMINGLCLGGGCELAMACDIRLASENAKLGQPEVNLGIMPGAGGTQRLPRLIGQGRARELIFTGDIIDAAEAERIGLVNRVYPLAELEAATMKMAAKMAAKSAFSLKMAKRSLRLGQEVGLAAGMAFETLAETAVFCHPDRTEGMDAFFEKRKAGFNGKQED